MFYKRIMQLLLLGLLAVYGVIGHAAESDDRQLMMHLVKALQEKANSVEGSDYRLGAGDTIRIVVFQNPISREIPSFRKWCCFLSIDW